MARQHHQEVKSLDIENYINFTNECGKRHVTLPEISSLITGVSLDL